MLASLFLILTGLIISFVVCVDHVAEFFNGWNYKNDWEPFRGTYLDYVRQIPYEVYIAAGWYPEACFITLIFFPLFILLITFYEVMHSDYTLFLMGWIPVMSGVVAMIVFGFMLLREPENPNAGNYKKF